MATTIESSCFAAAAFNTSSPSLIVNAETELNVVRYNNSTTVGNGLTAVEAAKMDITFRLLLTASEEKS